jgi:hypothetical protein
VDAAVDAAVDVAAETAVEAAVDAAVDAALDAAVLAAVLDALLPQPVNTIAAAVIAARDALMNPLFFIAFSSIPAVLSS